MRYGVRAPVWLSERSVATSDLSKSPASYTYSPYGQTAESGAAAANPFRYISGYQDTTGPEDYYKLGARYYDTHGHFTQPDPLPGNGTEPKTMTAYNYAGSDPINFADPNGRSFIDFVKKGFELADAYLTGQDLGRRINSFTWRNAGIFVASFAAGFATQALCGATVGAVSALAAVPTGGLSAAGGAFVCFSAGVGAGAFVNMQLRR
ncbi:MAG: RHS repeat-associated core domain-containing protein [Aeromicrobium sp.]